MFQEVDVEINELLFEWRALDHSGRRTPSISFHLAGTGNLIPSNYHLNSIEKDSRGNDLVSSRHYHHFIYHGWEGQVKSCGLSAVGQRTSDLSDGLASDFQWQHNARWLSEEDRTDFFPGQRRRRPSTR